MELRSAFSLRPGDDSEPIHNISFDDFFHVIDEAGIGLNQLMVFNRSLSSLGNSVSIDELNTARECIYDAARCLTVSYQRAVVAIGFKLVLCGGGQHKSEVGSANIVPQSPGEPTSFVNSSATTPGRQSAAVREDPGSDSHIIYTLDSDGYEHAVLTSASPSVVDSVTRVFHAIVQVFAHLVSNYCTSALLTLFIFI